MTQPWYKDPQPTVLCWNCHGSGVEPHYKGKCEPCYGTGHVLKRDEDQAKARLAGELKAIARLLRATLDALPPGRKQAYLERREVYQCYSSVGEIEDTAKRIEAEVYPPLETIGHPFESEPPAGGEE